jgi:RNA polymerase sigma-70 factor (ECF subfamily)
VTVQLRVAPGIRALVEGVPAADRSGDARFAAAVRAHEPVLSAIAGRLSRDAADAADLVQDTFERALRAWDRLPEDANVRAWLVTILNRLFIDRCRRARHAPAVDVDQLDPPCIEPAAPPVWANVTSEQLGHALDRLDHEFRRPYVLHAIEGRSYRDIADQLGIPANTVGTRLLRARRKLREILVAQLGSNVEASP